MGHRGKVIPSSADSPSADSCQAILGVLFPLFSVNSSLCAPRFNPDAVQLSSALPSFVGLRCMLTSRIYSCLAFAGRLTPSISRLTCSIYFRLMTGEQSRSESCHLIPLAAL